MTQRSYTIARVICIIGSCSTAACVGDASESPKDIQEAKIAAFYARALQYKPAAASEAASAAQPNAAPECERGILERDLFTLPLDGAAVSFGAVSPGEYVVSSTYLRLIESDAASAKFWEVVIPIMEDLGTRDGLAAVSLGLSLECNTARTLSVWRDNVAMYEFSASPAHRAAVAAGSQLNRGGSVVMHWTGDETQASWKAAAQQLAEYDGPLL